VEEHLGMLVPVRPQAADIYNDFDLVGLPLVGGNSAWGRASILAGDLSHAGVASGCQQLALRVLELPFRQSRFETVGKVTLLSTRQQLARAGSITDRRVLHS
jgi:hypothetical protein